MKRILLLAALPLLLTCCGPKEQEPVTDKLPLATITMASGETILIELYPEIAPNTVGNFIELAQTGFYDGLIFHRVIPGNLIQGGCPLGNGVGGPGYSIKGEFLANGYENTLSHEAGVISMARLPDNFDSAGSQFFITVTDRKDLDEGYAAFGRVVSGLEVVEAISETEKDDNDKPIEPQRIKSITVETFGRSYPPPDKIRR